MSGMGWAVKQMQNGEKVCRSGWNGKGMWLWLVPSGQWTALVGKEDVPSAKALPWIGMRTAQGYFVPWLASQTDMLAMDWEIAAGTSSQ